MLLLLLVPPGYDHVFGGLTAAGFCFLALHGTRQTLHHLLGAFIQTGEEDFVTHSHSLGEEALEKELRVRGVIVLLDKQNWSYWNTPSDNVIKRWDTTRDQQLLCVVNRDSATWNISTLNACKQNKTLLVILSNPYIRKNCSLRERTSWKNKLIRNIGKVTLRSCYTLEENLVCDHQYGHVCPDWKETRVMAFRLAWWWMRHEVERGRITIRIKLLSSVINRVKSERRHS